MIAVEIDQRSLDELWQLRLANHRAIRELQTTGDTAVTRMLAFVTTRIGEQWGATAPYLTGSLASATREAFYGDEAQVFTDPSVENPITGGFPSVYGQQVHQRKPWIERVYTDYAPLVLQKGAEQFYGEIDEIYNK